MGRPSDLPSREHFAALPCGTRAKYVSKVCRCLRCRAANSRYECARAAARAAGDWNGLVPAAAARAHLQRLSRHGVGRRAVRDACDVGRTVLLEIRTGRRVQIRRRTEQRILAVTRAAVADHTLVSAKRTHILIERLLSEGFTKTALARRLGAQGHPPTLQIRRHRVTAKTAAKVERLYQLLMLGGTSRPRKTKAAA